MTTLTTARPWDFSLALEVGTSLSAPDSPSYNYVSQSPPSTATGEIEVHRDYINQVEKKDFAVKNPGGLGDFGKIWEYLGVPSPITPASSGAQVDSGAFLNKADYASDGATYYKTGKNGDKTVTWETDGPTGGSTTDRSASPELLKLTKTQRKKKNRKERKAQEAASAVLIAKSGVVSESEADSIYSNKTPARKAGAHVFTSDLKKSVPAYGHNAVEHVPITPSKNTLIKHKGSTLPSKALPFTPKTNTTSKDVGSVTPRPVQINSAMRQQSQPVMNQTAQISKYTQPQSAIPQWPVSASPKSGSMKFVPSSVKPLPKQSAATPQTPQPSVQQAVSAVQAAMMQGTPSKRPNMIEPRIVRSGDDRHWALFLKIMNEFPEDRGHLVSPANMTTHNNNPEGIHVFVDASNIFIGFHDQLKRARGIDPMAKLPPANLSFDGLALLMERRRPVAKRVLAGSNPHVSAFDKAKAVGYECSIFEKVYKAREKTARQIYFEQRNAELRKGQRSAKALPPPPANSVLLHGTSPPFTGNGYLSGSAGSGSETTGGGAAPQYAKPALIEQGVDELLHLKMCESIIDYAGKPSTMVVATGDAAQAEYSQGFMAMAERALNAGWTIELVSWSRNISQMYLRKEWRSKWGDRFRIVYLDDFAEELLDM